MKKILLVTFLLILLLMLVVSCVGTNTSPSLNSSDEPKLATTTDTAHVTESESQTSNSTVEHESESQTSNSTAEQERQNKDWTKAY